jgi:hypothetical protein
MDHAAKLLRIRRRSSSALPGFELHGVGDVWALDTPTGRAALERLVELANKAYGPDTHWIEEQGSDPGEPRCEA